jgi:hypothetical protein
MVVSHRVSLSVAQSTHERVDRKEFCNGFDHIRLDVACIFGDLVDQSVCELLRLHHYGSIYPTGRF